jgi:hypothetical protein
MLMGRPKHRSRGEATLAVNGEARPALVHRHQLDRVDVEMGRKVGQPPEQVRRILRSHRVRTCIELVRGLLIAAGAHQREFRLGHSRLNRGDADAGTFKVTAQVERELADEGLGPGINRAALVGIGRRDR